MLQEDGKLKLERKLRSCSWYPVNSVDQLSVERHQARPGWKMQRPFLLFPDRNLDTSEPTSSRDLAPPLLRLVQAQLSFGSCLLRSAYPSHQTSSTFSEGPEQAPSPSQGSQICSHCTFTTCASQNSFPDSYPRLPPSCKMPTCSDIFLRLTLGCLTSFSAVCLGFVLYKWLSPSCLHIFSLPSSLLSSHKSPHSWWSGNSDVRTVELKTFYRCFYTFSSIAAPIGPLVEI